MRRRRHQWRNMLCRDVACDVQVQRMYVGVTSCRRCQVDAHRDDEAGPKDTYNMWAEYVRTAPISSLHTYLSIGIAAACNNATRAATTTRFIYASCTRCVEAARLGTKNPLQILRGLTRGFL